MTKVKEIITQQGSKGITSNDGSLDIGTFPEKKAKPIIGRLLITIINLCLLKRKKIRS